MLSMKETRTHWSSSYTRQKSPLTTTSVCLGRVSRKCRVRNGPIVSSISMIDSTRHNILCSEQRCLPSPIAQATDLLPLCRNLLINLPQPGVRGTTQSRPNSCKVTAYAHGFFYKRDATGQPTVMARRQGVGLLCTRLL